MKYGGVAVNVPTNSGFTNGTPPINLLSQANWPGLPLDSDGNPYLYLVSGDTLQCTYATALTTSDVLNVVFVGGDF